MLRKLFYNEQHEDIIYIDKILILLIQICDV